MFHWIYLLFNLLILVGVKLPFCLVVTLSWNATYYFKPTSPTWLSKTNKYGLKKEIVQKMPCISEALHQHVCKLDLQKTTC